MSTCGDVRMHMNRGERRKCRSAFACTAVHVLGVNLTGLRLSSYDGELL